MSEATYTVEDASESTSAADAAKELLGDEASEESTSNEPEGDAEVEAGDPADPNEVDLEASPEEGDEDEDEVEAKSDKQADALKLIKDLVDKQYNGNAEEFIKGYFNTNSRMAELVAKVDSLAQRGKFDSDDQPDEIEEVSVTADEDIAFYTENIQSLEKDIEEASLNAQAYLNEAGKASLALQRLEGRMENADDSDLPRLEAQKESLESQIRGLMDKNRQALQDTRQLDKQLKVEQRNLKSAERQAKSERAQLRNQRAQQQEAEQQIRESAGSDFSTTFDSLATKYNIPESAKASQREVVKALVSNQLRTLVAMAQQRGEELPTQDIKAMTEALGKAHFESLDAITRGRLSKVSKTKTPAPNRVKRTTSASQPAQPRKHITQMSQDDWEARKRAMDRYYDSL